MFTWIPLSSTITSELLEVVFQFAALGAVPCHTGVDSARSSSSAFSSDYCNSHLGTLAMTAINEILYRNCVPQDFEGFVLQLFGLTFRLLQTVLCAERTAGAAGKTTARISLLDET